MFVCVLFLLCDWNFSFFKNGIASTVYSMFPNGVSSIVLPVLCFLVFPVLCCQYCVASTEYFQYCVASNVYFQ